ncbi:MAG TPA: hypothetical protein VGR92_19910 [Steroidobacteraceae bacterium]|nr:hypothetical protein [Steroidobacteraceae bacterium]
MKNLDQGGATALQELGRHIERQLGQMHRPRLVNHVYTAQWGRHIRKRHVHRPFRQHRQKSADPPAPPARSLAPDPRCGAKIGADRRRLRQVFAPIDLLQLEHTTRAPALHLRPLHEGVGEVLFQAA